MTKSKRIVVLRGSRLLFSLWLVKIVSPQWILFALASCRDYPGLQLHTLTRHEYLNPRPLCILSTPRHKPLPRPSSPSSLLSQLCHQDSTSPRT
ncbi:hypothetical protein EDD18DRAFT_1198701 [Armillaria luteobubalina]|uniref:Uncharacterized protein n=1 Tax=Armillaria luteobubalina TaxID=153913 RepID=A0AA39PHB3_9AGAR|nr:hypothetical protein EDD18DRAFT_1198701 [Armillaria luteobubalina]